MNRIWPFIFLASAWSISVHAAGITFENLPDAYFFSSGGQNIGTHYAGLDFEPYVTGLSVTRFGGYDNAAFPTHSGDVAIWDPFDDSMTVSFTTPPDDIGFWYTSLNSVALTAFDAGGNPLGSATGNANSDGTTGTSDFLSISENGIASIEISSVAGQYVLDDLTYSSSPPTTSTPEPAAWAITAVGLLLLLLAIWRKRRPPFMAHRRALRIVPLLLLLVPCFLQAQALTNAQVTKMVQAKLSDQLIVNSIHNAAAVKFDLSPNSLIALKGAGVSDAVIEAMQSRSSGHRSSEAKESAVNNTNGRFPADIGVFYVTPEGKYILLEEDDASAHMKVGSMIMGAEFFGKYKEEAKIPGPEAKVATDRLPHFLIHVPQRDVSKFQVMKVWEIRPNERVVFRFVGRVNFRVKGHEIASSLSTTAVPGYVEMTPEKTLSEGEYGIVDLADIDKRTAKIWSFKIR